MKTSLKKALLSLISVSPMIVAVVLLVGLFQTYISHYSFSFLFGKSDILDTLAGTFIGSIAVGHGMMSYVIGEGFLQHGVSEYGVASFILAWVTLGFIQFPAEISVFGVRFMIYRNILTLLSTLLVTYLAVITVKAFS